MKACKSQSLRVLRQQLPIIILTQQREMALKAPALYLTRLPFRIKVFILLMIDRQIDTQIDTKIELSVP